MIKILSILMVLVLIISSYFIGKKQCENDIELDGFIMKHLMRILSGLWVFIIIALILIVCIGIYQGTQYSFNNYF